MKNKFVAPALAALFTLASCGGGGGSGGDPSPSTPLLAPSLVAGSLKMPGGLDGAGAAASFDIAEGVALDAAGNAYVADAGAHTIRKVSPQGVVTTFAGVVGGDPGSSDGTATAARFSSPRGVAVDANGMVYVADAGNGTIRRITPAGVVSTLAGSAGQRGTADGAGAAARFTLPTDLAIANDGSVLVLDNFALRRVRPDGTVSTVVATTGNQNSGTANASGGVAVDGSGRIHVMDASGTLRRYDASGAPIGTVTTNIGLPQGIAADAAGNVYVASGGFQAFAANPASHFTFNAIRRVAPDGTVSLVTGNDLRPGFVDGVAGSARIDMPMGVAVGAGGRIVFTDTNNRAIRQVDAAGNVSTLAGGDSAGSTDGPGPQARFNSPRGIVASSDGSLLVADAENQVVRRIAADGGVRTIVLSDTATSQPIDMIGTRLTDRQSVRDVAPQAGGGFFALLRRYGNAVSTVWDCNAQGACTRRLDAFAIESIATDATGRLFVASPTTVSRITSGGEQVQVAVGIIATASMRIGPNGRIYVADHGDHTVKVYDAAGTMVVLAGRPGQLGYADGTAITATFQRPASITVDASGNAFVGDGSFTVRRITSDGSVTTVAGVAFEPRLQLGVRGGSIGATPGGIVWVGGNLYATLGNAVLLLAP